MIRGLLRLLGFVALAGGFVAGVTDGARSLAASQISYGRLGEMLLGAFGERYLLLQPAIERHLHPLLWEPLLLNLMLAPTSLVLLVLAFVLLALGRRPREPGIGHAVGN